MATQRYISTSFWDDAWVQSIDPSEKLLYLYLMTNPLTNIAGIYKITDKRIHDDTGFNLDMIEKLMARFEKAGKAHRAGEYIIIPTWPKHQKWREKTTINTGIRKIIEELPNSIRDKAIKVGYQYPIDTVPISYTYRPSYLNSDYDSDLDIDTDTDSTIAPPADSDHPPEPVPASPSAVAVVKKPTDPLYQAIWDSFIAITPTMANYGAQGKATHRLVEFVRKHADAEDAPEFARQLVTKYYDLTQGREGFWRGQPFTPMNLSSAGILDRVLLALNQSANQEVDLDTIPF